MFAVIIAENSFQWQLLKGINVLDQYAISGNFDFLTIVEVDDENKIDTAVVDITSRGSIKTATNKATPIDVYRIT